MFFFFLRASSVAVVPFCRLAVGAVAAAKRLCGALHESQLSFAYARGEATLEKHYCSLGNKLTHVTRSHRKKVADSQLSFAYARGEATLEKHYCSLGNKLTHVTRSHRKKVADALIDDFVDQLTGAVETLPMKSHHLKTEETTQNHSILGCAVKLTQIAIGFDNVALRHFLCSAIKMDADEFYARPRPQSAARASAIPKRRPRVRATKRPTRTPAAAPYADPRHPYPPSVTCGVRVPLPPASPAAYADPRHPAAYASPCPPATYADPLPAQP
ncbi:hypothetical protein GPALN_012150 [Globodera pallida]|nr:hypothetical protein GPALN_012150 [Globodera pallida]